MEIAIRIQNSGNLLMLEFSLKQVEEIIKSRDKVICDLEKANDALKTYSEEVKKLRTMF